MKDIKVTDSVKYIGVDDHDIDLFESQYVVPNGVSYNSYVILDEKVAVMDTVDARKTDEWLANLEEALEGRNVDYIVVSHMEPDHAASLQVLAEKYLILIIEQQRTACGLSAVAFSRKGSRGKLDLSVLVSCGNSRTAGKQAASSLRPLQ